MKSHQYASIFPMLSTDRLIELADDIKANGQRDAITILDGEILDGRNRFKACEMASVEPRVEQYEGTDPLGFVLSHNLHRRHLTESQRASVAAKIANLGKGRPEINTSIDVLSPITQPQAAQSLNVSLASVQRAKRVIDHGAPELQEMVDSGEMSVNAASKVARLPMEKQLEAIKAGPNAIKQAVKPAPKPEPEKTGFGMMDGMDIYSTARGIMERINKTDKYYSDAFESMIEYCQQKLSK